MKKQIICIAISLGLLFSCGYSKTATAAASETVDVKEEILDTKEEMKVNQVGDYTKNCTNIDGVLYEAHNEVEKEDFDKETLLHKIKNSDTDDISVQFELKDKFYESQTYRELISQQDNYADPYDFLQDLRDACNNFYRAQISEMAQDNLFSHNDYYSCFYDVSDFVFNSKDPYKAIKSFTRFSKIENVVVSEKHEAVSTGWFGSFYGETVETINASKCITKDSRLLTGAGIKVGVSEKDMKDVKVNCSNHSNFTLDPDLGSGSNNCEKHSHFVMSAITSMAPDVEIYGSNNDNRGINWLIRQNVSVINCSWTYLITGGEYCSLEKHFDTLALDNYIVFVFAAGNYDKEEKPDYKLGCPTSAYNVITVGATDNNGKDIASYSCYETTANVGKPNLVANGSPHLLGSGVENKLHNVWGTSAAAPLVTGAVVLLQDCGFGLGVCVASALLAASANMNKITNPGGTAIGGFDSKAGAGMLDVDRLIYDSHQVPFSVFSVPSNKIVTEFGVWLYAGLPLKVCASWYAQPLKGNFRVTDYDLRLLDSAGKIVAVSSSAYNNQELLTFTPAFEGSYKIQLYMYSSSLDDIADYGSIAYSFDFDTYES